MKKILLVIDSLTSGGAQRQIVGLAKLLHEKGYNVKLIYYHNIEFYKPFLDGNGVKNELIEDSSNAIKRIFNIRKAIKDFNPDVIISYLDTPNIITCLLKFCGMRYKLIVSERNTTQILNYKEKIKFLMMRWANIIVPNSYSQEKFIQNNFQKLANKVHTITNFVDTDFFVPSNFAISDICKIISVGRVSEQKNTLFFLQALNCLKKEGLSFHVDWYGYSIPHYWRLCEEYIQENNLSDVISFHKPSNNIVNKYQECDVFILPSIYEGFPNVVCEAMCCGKPILCGDICDNSLIVKNGINGYLFDPFSVDDMINKIRTFITLSSERKKTMGIESRKLSLEKFSSDLFIKKYIDLIEN